MRTVETIEAQEASLKEEKKLLKAEAAFREKKKAGKLTRADKTKMFDTRQKFRLEHRKAKTGAAVGAIGTRAKQGKVG